MLKLTNSFDLIKVVEEMKIVKTVSLQADMKQAPQVPNSQQQPGMVGRKKLSTMVAPEYEPKLLYMQVFAPSETVM